MKAAQLGTVREARHFNVAVFRPGDCFGPGLGNEEAWTQSARQDVSVVYKEVRTLASPQRKIGQDLSNATMYQKNEDMGSFPYLKKQARHRDHPMRFEGLGVP
jgi:hypothetical protein